MLNNFFKDQTNHNVNEKNRLNKLAKKHDNYENKKKYLLQKYNNNNHLQKNFEDLEKINDFKNIDNVLMINTNKINFLENNKIHGIQMEKISDIEYLNDFKNIDNIFSFNIDNNIPIKFNLDFLENNRTNDKHIQSNIISPVRSNIINTLIKQINFVYQYNYSNNQVSGFGDFIRGCFYSLQFSEKYNIKLEFHINEHPIKNYLSYFENKPSLQESISQNIPFFKILNYIYSKNNNIVTYEYKDDDDILINYINSLEIYDGNVYLYIHKHPNEAFIKKLHKEKMIEILQPNEYLKNKTISSMNNLNLNKGKFKVIHIRYEDDVDFKNISVKKNNNRMDYILYIIKSIILKTNDDIFLISNKKFIKTQLIKQIPNIKTIFNDTTHVACRETNNEDSLTNTLQDFFIMSNSNYIYSFSVYEHGTGFSKWCATTYDIPYICFFLE
jgi:hypothetical protein